MLSTSTNNILTPIKLGDIDLPNRAVVSAMTRNRADKESVPSALMVEYYSSRASAGLILTECAAVTAEGNGFPGSGALYNDIQAAGWKDVTDAVHAKGGRIFLQIFHSGRSAHPD